MKKLLLIDGNSLINRAFYALPPLSSDNGELCNAVYGFCNMIISSIEKIAPDNMVVAFDMGKPTFRHSIYAEYKGTRKKMPDELAVQLPLCKNVLSAMNIKYAEKSGLEADDIIGKISHIASKDMKVVIVSGDKDLLQLVNENTTVMLTQRGLTEVKNITHDNIKENFGVNPSQIIDLKSLMGDTSDNIPGVPGVGAKTADTLLKSYQNLDNIYNHIDEINGKLREKLENNKDLAYLSYKLATIDINCDYDVDLDNCKLQFPFSAEVRDVFDYYNFRSLVGRKNLFLEKEINEEDLNIKSIISSDLKSNLDLIVDGNFNIEFKDVSSDDLIALLNNCNEFVFVEINELSYFYINDIQYIVDTILLENMIFTIDFVNILKNKNIKKILYDTKDIMHKYNTDIENFVDISIMNYLLNNKNDYLPIEKFLIDKNIDKPFVAVKLFDSYIELKVELVEKGMDELYSDIELPLIYQLYNMENNGIKMDKDTLIELIDKYDIEMQSVVKEIYDLVGIEFNINSPIQLKKIIFEDLGIKYKGKKNTNIEVLEEIEDQHEVISKIIRYRKIAKLNSTYLTGFLPHLDKNNIVHTTYLQCITSTGRLASRNPNLQNIPIRYDEGKNLRKLFVSRFENGSITAADYSQIELRLMAHFCKDKEMIFAYKNDIDIHQSTAANVYNIPVDKVTNEMRRNAKMVNFGIIYGISEFGLAKNLGVSFYEAKDFIEKYFETYKGVKNYINDSIQLAKDKGYAETLFGRKRYILELNSINNTTKKFGERIAINTPVQGTASDIIKIAMLKVANKIDDLGLKSKLILQIHDELIIDTHPDEVEIVKSLLEENMNNVVKLDIPLVVEVANGKSWYDCK